MEPDAKRWMAVALLAGVAYALIGITFAIPTAYVRVWRLSAWVLSALIFVAHVWFERIRLQHRILASAMHAALAAAVGAFGLALGANVHSVLVSSDQHRRLLLLALAIWPLLTALPAFIVGMVLSSIMGRTNAALKRDF